MTLPKFDHAKKSLQEACGVSQEQLSEIGKQLDAYYNESNCFSMMVEKIENLLKDDPVKVRCFLVYYIMLFQENIKHHIKRDAIKKLLQLFHDEGFSGSDDDKGEDDETRIVH